LIFAFSPSAGKVYCRCGVVVLVLCFFAIFSTTSQTMPLSRSPRSSNASLRSLAAANSGRHFSTPLSEPRKRFFCTSQRW
jgi:hypothetical protein